jgi:hypothetical protein
MAPKPAGPSAPIGIPRELDTKINRLGNLLKHLPDSLPLDPPVSQSRYQFSLDPDDVKEEGQTYAFNRNLEVCFQTHKLQGNPLLFTERGKRLETLVKMIKAVVKENSFPNDRGHQFRWIERLIQAATDSGAKIPQKRCAKMITEIFQ